MPRLRSRLGVVLLAGAVAAGSAWSRCGSAYQLIEPPGSLQLVDPTGIQAPGGRRAYVFAGTSLMRAAVATATMPIETLDVPVVPVSWGTRLVSPGAQEMRVVALQSGRLGGALVQGARSALGGIIDVPGRPGEHVVFVLGGTPRDDVATLELLYALVLRVDSEARFQRVRFDGCTPSTGNAMLGQSELLHDLAQRRNATIDTLDESARPMMWSMVRIRPVARGDVLSRREVRALVEDADGPLVDVSITLSRAPHSGCTATTDAEGIGRCVLQDSHGDDDDAHDDGPVVATFAGSFSATRIAPPMSAIID